MLSSSPSQAHQTRVSTLSGQGSRPYPAGYPRQPPGVRPSRRGFPLPFSCRRSLLRSSLPRWRHRPSLRSAHRPRRSPCRPPSGLPRSTHASCDRIGCPLDPGAAVLTRLDRSLSTGACRFPAASPARPALTSHPRASTMTRQHRGFTHVHPPGLSLTRGPRMERGPFGLNPGLRTPRLPATHAGVGTGHRALARATSPSSRSPLNATT